MPEIQMFMVPRLRGDDFDWWGVIEEIAANLTHDTPNCGCESLVRRVVGDKLTKDTPKWGCQIPPPDATPQPNLTKDTPKPRRKLRRDATGQDVGVCKGSGCGDMAGDPLGQKEGVIPKPHSRQWSGLSCSAGGRAWHLSQASIPGHALSSKISLQLRVSRNS